MIWKGYGRKRRESGIKKRDKKGEGIHRGRNRSFGIMYILKSSQNYQIQCIAIPV